MIVEILSYLGLLQTCSPFCCSICSFWKIVTSYSFDLPIFILIGNLNHDIACYLWQAKIFHYGSISLITEPCRSAHLAAAKAAKDAGAILSYDPNLRLPLWPSAESAREGILSIWETADVIKVYLLLILLSSRVCVICWCTCWNNSLFAISKCRYLFHFWVDIDHQINENAISFLTQGEDPYDDSVVRKLYLPDLKLLLVTEGSEGCRYYTKVSLWIFQSLPTCFYVSSCACSRYEKHSMLV